MRACILTAPGLEHAFVTNALLEAIGDQVVGVVLESRAASLQSALRRYSPPRVAERLVTKIVRRALRYEGRQEQALRDVLGASRLSFRFPAGLPVLTSHGLNQAPAIADVSRLQPTHIFVYGTGIVGRTMRELAPMTLNLHTGISPYYRGSDTEFWALWDGRPELVGATVHLCAAAVDGGDIFATAPARLVETDGVFQAFARAVEAGADLYAGVARRLAEGEDLRPVPQDLSLGRAYRFIDRTFLHDLRMEFLVHTGRLRRVIVQS